MTTKEINSYFGHKFTEAISIWKAEQKRLEKPNKQQDFVEQVRKLWESNHPDADACPLESYYVTDWKTGRSGYPHKYINEICEVLGVNEEFFSIEHASHDEKYENSSDFITEIAKDHVEFANRKGLNLDLIRALTKIVDFDELFPLYSPIGHYTEDPDTGKKIYDREVDFKNSAQVNVDIDQKLQFLQLHRYGKTILLHRCDLAVLKDMQDKIIEYVEGLFLLRAREMKKEVDAVNDYLDGEELTAEIEMQFDRYAKIYRDQFDFDGAEKFSSGEDFDKARSKILDDHHSSRKDGE